MGTPLRGCLGRPLEREGEKASCLWENSGRFVLQNLRQTPRKNRGKMFEETPFSRKIEFLGKTRNIYASFLSFAAGFCQKNNLKIPPMVAPRFGPSENTRMGRFRDFYLGRGVFSRRRYAL